MNVKTKAQTYARSSWCDTMQLEGKFPRFHEPYYLHLLSLCWRQHVSPKRMAYLPSYKRPYSHSHYQENLKT